MEKVTLYSEVRIDTITVESLLRENGYLKPEQKVNYMHVKNELVVSVQVEKKVIQPTLTPDQEKILEGKSLADFGLTPFQQKNFAGMSLREIVSYPEEELLKLRHVKASVLNKLKKGLSDIGLSLAQVE